MKIHITLAVIAVLIAPLRGASSFGDENETRGVKGSASIGLPLRHIPVNVGGGDDASVAPTESNFSTSSTMSINPLHMSFVSMLRRTDLPDNWWKECCSVYQNFAENKIPQDHENPELVQQRLKVLDKELHGFSYILENMMTQKPSRSDVEAYKAYSLEKLNLVKLLRALVYIGSVTKYKESVWKEVFSTKPIQDRVKIMVTANRFFYRGDVVFRDFLVCYFPGVLSQVREEMPEDRIADLIAMKTGETFNGDLTQLSLLVEFCRGDINSLLVKGYKPKKEDVARWSFLRNRGFQDFSILEAFVKRSDCSCIPRLPLSSLIRALNNLLITDDDAERIFSQYQVAVKKASLLGKASAFAAFFLKRFDFWSESPRERIFRMEHDLLMIN